MGVTLTAQGRLPYVVSEGDECHSLCIISYLLLLTPSRDERGATEERLREEIAPHTLLDAGRPCGATTISDWGSWHLELDAVVESAQELERFSVSD